MQRLLLLIFLAGGLLQAQSPDPVFQGTWLGKMTQNRPAPFNEYRFRLHIGQKGNVLYGTTHMSMQDSMEIFAEMEFTGFASEEVMTFQETRINRQNKYQGSVFCIKNGTLRVTEKGGLYRLEGDWEGMNGPKPCTPGRLILEKLNPNPPPDPADSMLTTDPAFKSYGSLDGRNIDRQRDVEVNRKTLTVYVWDADKVDGDVISLSFNGKWLLRNYPIKKEKQAIELVLDDNADNRLILYAENEGKYPPNTAALTFFDGEKQRNLNLMSTESTCGAIRFIAKQR